MKYRPTLFITGLAVTVFLSQATLPVFANNLVGQRLVNNVNQWQNQASRAAVRQHTQLQDVIHRSDTMLTYRLTTLNNMNTRIQSDTRLSASEKTSLATAIQTDITGLTTLKTTIDADTNIIKARSDEKQIITGYYIYAMFEPRTRLLIVLNNLQTVTANLQALVPQIQSLINAFQSRGKEVSSLQSLLNDVSSQLQTINTTLTNDVTTIQNVSVTTTNPQATFTQVHQDISQIVRSGFAKIRSDFAQMRPLFHQLIFNTPSTSATPNTTQPLTATSAPTLTATP